MLAIRLQRVGRKNDPHFRVIVTDRKRASKSGSHIEILGWQDPRAHKFELKSDRAKFWLSKGAKPSDTVHNLLVSAQIISGPKVGKGKKSISVVKAEVAPLPVEAVQKVGTDVVLPESNEVASS